MKIAIITGASSGIGMEFVKQLDKSCNDLDEIWAVSRNATETVFPSTKAAIVPVSMDLTKESELKRLASLLKKEAPSVKLLVNSAGVGYKNPFEALSLHENEEMILCNIYATTAVCHIVLPYICRGGYLIQLASSAAFMPQAGFAVYAASKAYVLSFSRALSLELKKRQISVTAICPGPVQTPFLDKSGNNPKGIRRLFIARPERVVAYGIACAKKRKSCSIYGIGMKIFYLLNKIIPQNFMMNFADKM